MCVDYQAINKIMATYFRHIPYFDDIIDELNGSYKFYNIDLRSGYHQMQMLLDVEW